MILAFGVNNLNLRHQDPYKIMDVEDQIKQNAPRWLEPGRLPLMEDKGRSLIAGRVPTRLLLPSFPLRRRTHD